MFLDSILDVADFIVSPRGSTQLLDTRGYIYSKERTSKFKTNWVCTAYSPYSEKRTKCPVRVGTIDSKIVKFKHEHNHSPQHEI